MGGDNQFEYAPNPIEWVDPYGLQNNKLGDCDDPCKGRTEPTLPSGTIAQSGEIRIEHYYMTDDHGPAHAHVKGGGKTTRIGALGYPLAGDPPLTKAQEKVVAANRSKIRKDLGKISRWLNYQKECNKE